MEEAVELSDYLPRSFNRPNEQEYIAFLWDAFETNYLLADPGTIKDILVVENDVVPFDRADALEQGS